MANLDVDIRYTPPRTAVESALADLWAEVLLVDRVGLHDDFLELGGDSLSALGVIAAIETQFDRALDVFEFMSAASVRRVADLLR